MSRLSKDRDKNIREERIRTKTKNCGVRGLREDRVRNRTYTGATIIHNFTEQEGKPGEKERVRQRYSESEREIHRHREFLFSYID